MKRNVILLFCVVLFSFSCATAIYDLSQVSYSNLDFPSIPTEKKIRGGASVSMLYPFSIVGSIYKKAEYPLFIFSDEMMSWYRGYSVDFKKYVYTNDIGAASSFIVDELLDSLGLMRENAEEKIENLYRDYDILEAEYTLSFVLWDFHVIETNDRAVPVFCEVEWILYDNLRKERVFEKRIKTTVNSRLGGIFKYNMESVLKESMRVNLKTFLTQEDVLALLEVPESSVAPEVSE